jgi:hypothetical protein
MFRPPLEIIFLVTTQPREMGGFGGFVPFFHTPSLLGLSSYIFCALCSPYYSGYAVEFRRIFKPIFGSNPAKLHTLIHSRGGDT